jgi:hypothetical protein
MTAPLFAVFGWAGLFILPMLSVLLLWIRCWQTCRVLGLSQTGTTFALATLIFGLAITPYGAMFWEHAPATALAFFGIAELVEAQVAERSRLRLFLGGLLVGASAWLRPEAMVLAALVCALWAIPYWQARRTPAWMMFATGAGLAIIAFLLYNVLIYGGAFGLHSRQEGVLIPGVTAWTRARTFGWGMITLLVRTAPPVTVAVALGAWIALRNRTEQWRFAVPLVALVPAMVLAVPWIAPNAGGLQWGARYMLTALPVAAIICGWIVSKAGDHRHGRLIVATLGIALLAGAVSNVYAGTRTVHYMYQGRTEVLHGIADSNPGIPIVATDQYIPQELAGDLRLRPMFVLHEYPWNGTTSSSRCFHWCRRTTTSTGP